MKLTSFIEFLIFLIMSLTDLPSFPFYFLLFAFNVFIVIENVVVEYILVLTTKKENSKREEGLANHFPIYFALRAFTSIIGSYFGGRLLKIMTIQDILLLTSIAPFILFLISLIFNDHSFIPNENLINSPF